MTAVAYTFTASGVDSVISAFRSVPKAATDSAARVSKAADSQARAQERAAARAAASTSKEEAKRYREIEKYAAKAERQFEKEAQARVRAEQKANAQIASDRNAMLGRIAGAAGRVGKAALATTFAAGGLALATVGAAARESMRVGEIANRYSINAKLAGENVDATQARHTFESVALGTPGIKAQDVGEAALAFQSKTGKSLSKEQLDVLATASSGLGAEMQDIASAMASLHEKFDIKDVKQMQDALATLGVQGAKGSFELKDAAAQFEKLSAAAGRFGLNKGVRGVAVLGGFTQIARGSTGSPEQAATAVEATLRQLIAKSGELKAQGVNVFDKSGKARDLPTVLAEMVGKVGGKDIEKKKVGLQKILGEEGIRAVSPLITAFADATLDGKDGMEAVTRVLHDAIDTGGKWNQVQEAAGQAQQDASAQISGAWQKIVAAAGEELAPKLVEIAARVGDFTPALGVAIDALVMFAEATEGVIATLQELMPSTFKPSTRGQQRELEKSIGALDKEAARSGVPTPGQMALREKYTKELERLQAGGAAVPTETPTLMPALGKLKIFGPENPEGGPAPGGTAGPVTEDAQKAAATNARLADNAGKAADAHERAARSAERLAQNLANASEMARNLPINQR